MCTIYTHSRSHSKQKNHRRTDRWGYNNIHIPLPKQSLILLLPLHVIFSSLYLSPLTIKTMNQLPLTNSCFLYPPIPQEHHIIAFEVQTLTDYLHNSEDQYSAVFPFPLLPAPILLPALKNRLLQQAPR